MVAIPFDAALLDGYRAVHGAGSGPMSLERLPMVRAEDAAEVPPLDDLRRGGRFEVTSRSVPGASGTSEAELLICTPAAVSGLAASRPAIYFVHGGGYFSGDPRHLFFLEPLLDEAERLGASLISAGYRLAPEHPHPAPLDDVYAGLLWTAEHAAELGLDADRIVVAGTSAGGGLAAALTLSVRDKGGPRLVGQLLMCPMLDDRNDSASAHQMDGVDVWDRGWNGFGWKALLGSECGGPDVSPYAAPARATDLSGLPPAFIDVGSAETLRDEAVAYADRIWRAGGSAELHVWSGGYHTFDLVVPDAVISRAAWQARRSWLERVLAAD
ncbi:alpha/beta hydrolase [Streptomyces kanamyceticus]|uniref:Alpha/beta hydrolase n=1 Tax=Streptomyces kanamyceticus TaxID=1967 RepID=A0A5J6GT21_STRKN|nr:alpha/beta hydrolase [Streptomyces kanamyceticus]QEU96918.1 alpha/beta hydrolase [Streptomyces kanamyceticus]